MKSKNFLGTGLKMVNNWKSKKISGADGDISKSTALRMAKTYMESH